MRKNWISFVVIGALSAPVFGANRWVECRPRSVASFDERIHVECSNPSGQIRFFALPTNDAARAARTLSLLSTALVSGKAVSILFDPADASGPSFNCLASDCRPIIGVSVAH